MIARCACQSQSSMFLILQGKYQSYHGLDNTWSRSIIGRFGCQSCVRVWVRMGAHALTVKHVSLRSTFETWKPLLGRNRR